MKLTDDIHRVPYGSQNILFSLQYSPRKTLAIEVHPDCQVVVKAPTGATLDAIEQRVIHRAAWITKQQRQFERYAPPLPPAECRSGEEYRYLGRQYRLKIITSDRVKVRLWQGRLEVSTPTPTNRQQIETSIDNWYRDRALLVFNERYEYCLAIVAPYHIHDRSGWAIRTMSKRWGSCTPEGKIFLNPLLVRTPKNCIDYVIIHELCHRRYPNHSRDFYTLLGTIVPDWQQRREILNCHSPLRSIENST